jgi:hypothetical protein
MFSACGAVGRERIVFVLVWIQCIQRQKLFCTCKRTQLRLHQYCNPSLCISYTNEASKQGETFCAEGTLQPRDGQLHAASDDCIMKAGALLGLGLSLCKKALAIKAVVVVVVLLVVVVVIVVEYKYLFYH